MTNRDHIDEGGSMKKSTKALLLVSTFVVAMNLNGCGVYGPPVSLETTESEEVIETSVIDIDSSQG